MMREGVEGDPEILFVCYTREGPNFQKYICGDEG